MKSIKQEKTQNNTCTKSMTADPGHTYRTAGSDYSCTYRVYIPVHTSNYHKKLGNPFV